PGARHPAGPGGPRSRARAGGVGAGAGARRPGEARRLTHAEPAMSTKPPDLGKGSFFYRKSAVEQVLQDRDLMLRYLQQRPRDAEDRVAGLEAQLTSATNDAARADKELARLEGELADATARLAELERGRQRVQAEARALGDWRMRVGSMTAQISKRLA